MENSTPEFLYRYRKLNALELTTLLAQKLYFSSYRNMNDPMEGYYKKTIPVSEYDELIEPVSEIFESKYLSPAGVCSLSERNDIDLMWAHYTNFGGICVKLNVNRMLESLGGGYSLSQVSYSAASPKIDLEDIGDLGSAARRILSRKKDTWKYEAEWRIFSEKIGLSFVGDAIDSVFIGDRASSDELNHVSVICKHLGVSLFKMKISGYSFNFHPVNIGGSNLCSL